MASRKISATQDSWATYDYRQSHSTVSCGVKARRPWEENSPLAPTFMLPGWVFFLVWRTVYEKRIIKKITKYISFCGTEYMQDVLKMQLISLLPKHIQLISRDIFLRAFSFGKAGI
jgi:hypothetical protein